VRAVDDDRPAPFGPIPPPLQHTRLADGRDVAIRRATNADLAGVIDFFERLSAASRYARFFSPQPRLRRDMIARIVAGGPDRMSVLAQPPEFSATTRNVVAVGSWIYDPHDARAEISIAVADAWQNNGLGTSVVLVLLRAAFAAGCTRFAAEVLGTNARMLGLLRELGAPCRSYCEAGVVRVEFELPGGDRGVAAA
jgi:RimJ/RimL family protein N-acetyltransferase